MMRRAVTAMVMLTAVGAATVAHAEDDERAATYAVQNRKHRLGFEMSAELGTLPLNAFTKGVTVGGAVAYHFSDWIGWEVAQFAYSFGVDTDLKKQLLENFQVQPTSLESVNYFGSSNFLFKPMYGKYAVGNKYTMHSEWYLAAGPAFAKYIQPSTFRGGFDIGLGFRWFIVRHFSARIDIRDYVFFKGSSPKNELHLALLLNLSFGRDKQQ